jgi:hypothetical protein
MTLVRRDIRYQAAILHEHMVKEEAPFLHAPASTRFGP